MMNDNMKGRKSEETEKSEVGKMPLPQHALSMVSNVAQIIIYLYIKVLYT